MKNLIAALNIFLKYKDSDFPTHCEHDVLWICGYKGIEFSEEDRIELKKLGFFEDEGDDCWKSYRYGSA